MFPLRHPLRTPQLAEQPAAQPNTAQLELTDEYIAELLLRDARNSAKLAEKYGVMSYLSGSRVVPQRKEKPDAQFFQNVVKSTIGLSEFQERKQQLQKMQAEEVAYYRVKHLIKTSSRGDTDEKDKSAKRSKKGKKEKKHKRDKKGKKERKETKERDPSVDSPTHTSAGTAVLIGPLRPALPKARGRGARAFNPQDPDRGQNDCMYESLPVQREDPPEITAKLRDRDRVHSSSDSASYSSRSRSRSQSRSRSPSPRRRRSPSPERRSRSYGYDRYRSGDEPRRRDRREP